MNFFSAGIMPISQPNMDARSPAFLDENDVVHDFHTPKKINQKMLNYFDRFLAVDHYAESIKYYIPKKHKHKFQSLTKQFHEIILDPYHLPLMNILKIMNDIRYVSENINLEEV